MVSMCAHAHSWLAHEILKGTTEGEEMIFTDQMESGKCNRDAVKYIPVFI